MFKHLLLLGVLLLCTNSFAQNFTTIWNTTEPGTSANNEITIPTNAAFTYNYTVDWGDGTNDTGVVGDITHTYATPGQYTVQISGDFPAIYFNNGGDRRKIIEILGWGTIAWQSMEDAFHGCENLNFDAIDAPNLLGVTSLRNMFKGCTLFNGIVNNWEVSTITDLSGIFMECQNFNRPLDNWNTANVVDMSETFSRCSSFNEPLDNWNTSSATSMRNMFYGCVSFNQNINNWDVRQVTDMSNMFWVCVNFNQPLNLWDVSNVTDMNTMFYRTNNFEQDLSAWQVGNVTNMSRMFDECAFNSPLNNWDVSNVTDMSEMFLETPNFNQPLNDWDVSNVTNMQGMFEDAIIFDQPLNLWNVSKVINMSEMFRGQSQFNQPLNDWDVSSVTNMAFMFERNAVFNQSVENWDVSKVTNMQGMFSNADAFDQPLGSWNVENVQNFSQTFRGTDVFNQPLNTWNITSMTSMVGIFQDAMLFNQPLDNWDVNTIGNMSFAFNNAASFNQDISSWNIENAFDITDMLSNSGLSQENYDALLIAWAALDVNNDLTLGAASLEYCDGRFARQELIDSHNWTFSGDAVNCTFVLCTEITSPLNTDTQVPANSDIRWAPAPNATGYRVTLEVERGGARNFVIFNGDVADNLDVGNVVGLSFTNEFLPGDTVYVTVVPYNSDGPVTGGCDGISFTVVESWVNSPDAFKITIDTRNLDTNSTNANQYQLELNTGFPDNLVYNFSVDWGDGQYNNNVSSNITHTYLNPGVYTIAIIGDFPSFYHNSSNRDNLKLISMDQWGTQVWQSMRRAFYFCENMEYNASDTPNLTQVSNMESMFRRTILFNSDINNWDVGNITDMGSMFYQATIYDQPMDNWDVTNVTNMRRLFSACTAFNQNINNWNVANVETMDFMFEGASNFDQPLNGWTVDNVNSMQSMFQQASVFDQPIGSWNVANVENMQDMFSSAELFNQNIDGWNVGNVELMNGMFQLARAFNQPLNSWDVSKVKEMRSMFASTANFDQPLNEWEVDEVVDMSSMFTGAQVFNQNIEEWNVTNVLTMRSMFQSANLFNQPLNDWDVNSVVNMQGMFSSAGAFNQPINNWEVSAVANMAFMFNNALAFDQPLDNWNVSSVTLMPGMFQGASVFNQDINSWNVAVVTNMQGMFKNALVFDSTLDNWDTGEVLNMAEMFSGASAFDQPIENWNVSFVTTMFEMFKDATSYNQDMDSWNVASVNTMQGMFQGTTSFNGAVGNWNVRRVTTMQNMFFGASNFNQNINDWRVNGVENMDSMFRDATMYNQNMEQWNLGSVNMNSMFRDAASFDQFLGDWNVENVNNMQNMLDNTALTRENYDNTLIEWSEQTLTPGITFGALTLPYCDAETERQSIIDTYGWNITGDVRDCPIPGCTQLIAPEVNDTDVPVNTNLIWEAALYATGYKLTIDVDGTITNITLGEVTTYEFPTDFVGGEIVSVTITPFNGAGDAIGCDPESFTISNAPATFPDCTVLTVPANITDVPVDTDLMWEPIANADGYRLTVGTTSGGNDLVDNEDVGNVTEYDFAMDLDEDQDIFVTIIPYNNEGSPTTCPEQSFKTEIIPVPPTCTNLTAPEDGDTGVLVDTDISWQPVDNATGYLITIGTTSGGIEVANSIDVGNMTTYDIPMDLQENRIYFVTIVPYNDVGDAIGCSGAEESFRTIDSSSNLPDCTSLIAPENDDTDVAINLAEISWNAVADADGYRITIDGSTSDANDVTDLVVNGTSHPFANDFDNGEIVTVTIIPFNADGDASGCAPPESFTIVSATAMPPLCTTLVAPENDDTDVAINLAAISWNAVANADGYRITIDGSTSDANDVTDLVVNGTSHPFANDFDNGEIVTVTIIPFNADGDASGCAPPESFTIVSEMGSVPECTSLSAALINATTVSVTSNLTWDAINGAEGYRLTVGTTSGGTDILDDIDVGNVLTYDLIDDLPYEQEIFVTIIPYNSLGDANGCAEQSFTTVAEPTPPACTNLLTPLNLDIDVPIGVTLSWNAAPGANGYRLTVGTETGIGDIINNQDLGNVTSFNLPNDLPENTEIFVALVPYNGVGDAEFCEEESFITETLAPLVPPCTTITIPENGSTDVSIATAITWNAIGDVDGYIINIGTTSGGTDILDSFDAGLTTSYDLLEDLPFEQEIFVSVLPYNEVGTAIDCEIHSFTTTVEPEIESLFGFSPDNDGINDFWVIEGIESYPENTVVIFNRWGDMVFQIDGYDNNSNVFRGEANQLTGLGAGQLPEGTYFFQLILPEDHNLKQTKGYLVLKR